MSNYTPPDLSVQLIPFPLFIVFFIVMSIAVGLLIYYGVTGILYLMLKWGKE